MRFLQLLLEAPAGAAVSLEVLDDVGVVRADRSATASQTKSALVKNPVSNRAVDLWKTFSNWAEQCVAGTLVSTNTQFEIYLGKKRTGSIVKSFHDAQTPEQAEKAIADARDILWGPGPFYKGRAKLPAELRKLTDNVLSIARTKTASEVVLRFRLASPTKNPISDVRSLVNTKWVRPESVDLVVRHAYGWVKERLDSLLQDRKPAILLVDEFNEEMARFLPRCDFRTILMSVAGKPDPADVEAQRAQIYVRQLELIDASDEDTIQAINEYLRATVQRTDWSRAGIVHEDSFDEFEEALIAFWRNKRRHNSLTHSSLTAVQQGQLLLSECCIKTQTLQGLEVPSYFTPGSYHDLADDLTVGWHPDYSAQLPKDKS